MSTEDMNLYALDDDQYPHAYFYSTRSALNDLSDLVNQYKGKLPPEIADEVEDYLLSIDDTRS